MWSYQMQTRKDARVIAIACLFAGAVLWIPNAASSLRATIDGGDSVSAAVDVTGAWTLELDPDFGGNRGTTQDCTFKQEGRRLTGSCGGHAAIAGEVNRRKVTFKVKTGRQNEFTATFTGNLNEPATTIKGKWRLEGNEGNFEARRPPSR